MCRSILSLPFIYSCCYSVRWIITHEEAPGVETNTLTMFSIRNHVTKKSDDPTHLRVGEKFESDTYRLSLTVSYP